MRKVVVLCASALAALTVPLDAQAHGATWTMPYQGSCTSGICIDLTVGTNKGILVTAAPTSGIAIHGSGYKAVEGYGYPYAFYGLGTVFASNSNGTAVEAYGFLGASGTGVIGLAGSGSSFGLQVTGGTSPINFNGPLPSVGNNPLCKSTSGSTAGHIGFCSSTRAQKEEIQDLDLGVDTLMRLRPVSFRWKSDHAADLGFVAEDVAKVNPVLAVYNERGQLQSVKYTQMTALLTKVLQDQVRQRNKVEVELRKQVSDLRQEKDDATTELRKQNAALMKQVAEQQNLLKSVAARLSAVEQHAAASK